MTGDSAPLPEDRPRYHEEPFGRDAFEDDSYATERFDEATRARLLPAVAIWMGLLLLASVLCGWWVLFETADLDPLS